MNTRFIVDKLTRKKIFEEAPVEPEMIGGKRDEHGAHAEIDPATGFQGAHAGVEKWIAGFSFLPSFKVSKIIAIGAKIFAKGVKTVELDLGFAFQFLHEMAVPVEPRQERAG